MKPKNHITNLKCFPKVAAVIGNANAQRELFKAVHSDAWCRGGEDIMDSFLLCNSPQKDDFWHLIYNGINPYTGDKNG